MENLCDLVSVAFQLGSLNTNLEIDGSGSNRQKTFELDTQRITFSTRFVPRRFDIHFVCNVVRSCKIGR
jgi:hypothetical protein